MDRILLKKALTEYFQAKGLEKKMLNERIEKLMTDEQEWDKFLDYLEIIKDTQQNVALEEPVNIHDEVNLRDTQQCPECEKKFFMLFPINSCMEHADEEEIL